MTTQPEALLLAEVMSLAFPGNLGIDKAAAELRRLSAVETQRDALLEALKEAAASLETVGRLAGKSDYLGDDGERIPTYMGRHDEVREYAISRAGVARAAIALVEGRVKSVEETK